MQEAQRPSRAKTILVTVSITTVLLVVATGTAYYFHDHFYEDRYIKDLETGDWVQQQTAIKKLAGIRSAKAVPELTKLLEGVEVRESAGTLGAREMIAKVSKLGEAMVTVASILEEKGKSSASNPGQQVFEIMGQPEVLTRALAAHALGQIGLPAAPAVPALARLLKDPSMTLRMFAAAALGGIRAMPEVAVPALAQALKDPEEPVRRNAAITLGDLGASAKVARPALLEVIGGPDAGLSRIAREALAKIEGDS